MALGKEQVHNPELSFMERMYVALFGMPVIGLRIRGRNIFALIPAGQNFKRILDAGSGPGVFTFELARRFKSACVTGIDLDPLAVNISRRIAQKAGFKNVRFRHSSIEKMPLEKSYDLIICVDILEHIKEDQAAIARMFALLSSGGALVLHVPALYRRYPVWQKRINFNVPTHIRPGYDMADIRDKVEQTGFVVKEHGYTYGFFETLANNISYMITRAEKKNKLLYAVAFPILNMLSLLGSKARPQKMGAGIFFICRKCQSGEGTGAGITGAKP